MCRPSEYRLCCNAYACRARVTASPSCGVQLAASQRDPNKNERDRICLKSWMAPTPQPLFATLWRTDDFCTLQAIPSQGRLGSSFGLVPPGITQRDPKKSLVVDLKPSNKDQFSSGNIILFSPTNPDEDSSIEIKKEMLPVLRLDVKEFRKGNWTVKLDWEFEEKQYYLEQVIQL